jgi:mannose/fructose-specific phosphotransferase system component IIA
MESVLSSHGNPAEAQANLATMLTTGSEEMRLLNCSESNDLVPMNSFSSAG